MRKTILACATVAGLAALSAVNGGCANNDPANPLGGTAQALKAPELQGSWLSNCTSGSTIRGVAYERKSMEFKGQSVNFVTQLFVADSECKTADVEVKQSGAFDTGGESGEGKNIQFQLQQVSIRAKSDGGRMALNALSYCGINDYVNEVDRDVTAATQTQTPCWAKTPRTLYDIYRVQDRTMVVGMGAEGDKEGETKRPPRLDVSMPFTKQ